MTSVTQPPVKSQYPGHTDHAEALAATVNRILLAVEDERQRIVDRVWTLVPGRSVQDLLEGVAEILTHLSMADVWRSEPAFAMEHDPLHAEQIAHLGDLTIAAEFCAREYEQTATRATLRLIGGRAA